MVKDMGDLNFIIHILEENEIVKLYKRKWVIESVYLLAVVDYLSRENDLPLCLEYNDIRKIRFRKPIYPLSVICLSLALQSEEPKEEIIKKAIHEFLRYNIIETEVRNVC